MTFKNFITRFFLWGFFLALSVLAYLIPTEYKALKPYMTIEEIENLLLLSALMGSGLAGALIYIHGLKSWTTFPIGIGLIMAWWDHLVFLVLVTTMSSSTFGG